MSEKEIWLYFKQIFCKYSELNYKILWLLIYRIKNSKIANIYSEQNTIINNF